MSTNIEQMGSQQPELTREQILKELENSQPEFGGENGEILNRLDMMDELLTNPTQNNIESVRLLITDIQKMLEK